jgi:hypothetical protein
VCRRWTPYVAPTTISSPPLPSPFFSQDQCIKKKTLLQYSTVHSILPDNVFFPSINRCIQGYSRINPRIENLPCQWSMFMDSPELVIQNLISTRSVAKIYQGISPFLYLWWLDAGLGVGMPVVWLIFSFNYWFLHISWTL